MSSLWHQQQTAVQVALVFDYCPSRAHTCVHTHTHTHKHILNQWIAALNRVELSRMNKISQRKKHH